MSIFIQKKEFCPNQSIFTAAIRIFGAICRVVVLGLAFTTSASAANWFVRSASQGTANGTSWANAWSIANLNNSMGSLNPGDVVWIAGGAYTTGINWTRSGSSGNPITLRRPTGNDSAATSAAGWSSAFDSQVQIQPSSGDPFRLANNNTAWVTIDGQVNLGILLRYANNADAFQGAVAITGNGVNNITIRYCDLAGPGGASPYPYAGDNAPLNLRNTGTPQISYITVSHCTLRGGPNLVRTISDNNLIFEYCIFKDNASSSDQHDNMIYNEGGSDITIRYCDFSGWQVEGILLWNVGANANYYIYGNVFHDAVSGNHSVFWPGNESDVAQGNVRFYNNTFVGVNITTGQSRSRHFGSSSIARNNIYWNSSWAGNSLISNSDYNFSSGSTPGANSISSGSNPFVNEGANDFKIVSTVGAKFPRDKGIALTSPYNMAIGDITRGSDGAFDMGAYEYGTVSASPVISVSPASLNLGSINLLLDLILFREGSLTVQNVGGGTLAGTATVAAPFSIVSGGTYSLGPNQSQTVTVRFSPTLLLLGTLSRTVTFTGGGGGSVALSGTGTASEPAPAISITPASLAFGTNIVGTTKNLTMLVQNSGGGTLSGTASVTAPFSIVTGGTYSLAAGQSQTVTVRYSPTAAATHSGSVVLTGGGGGSVALSGTATVSAPVPAIAIAPSSLAFGTNNVGTTKDLTVTVQNSGGGTLSGTASVAAPFSIVTGGTYNLAAGQSQTVTVRYSPIVAGSSSLNVTFTGGGGATATASGVTTVVSVNLPPTVSAISQNAADIDPGTPGQQVYVGTVVQYSGSASDPNGNPLTWQWIYSVNGGAEVVYRSGAGAVTPASFSYGAGTAGTTYLWKLRANDGTATAESQLTVGVQAPAPPLGDLSFEAEAGNLTGPFTVANGYISQTSETGVTAGGRAAYSFNITNAGDYVIQATVNAPDGGANSFFVNIDAEPQDLNMIWQIIPMTSGFESRIVSWQGTGTFDNPQFVPKIFNLATGSHQLIIRGREANTQLDSFAILKVPSPPENLRVLPND